MCTFTGGFPGQLSDRSAAEVATAPGDEGIEIEADTDGHPIAPLRPGST